MEEAGVRVLVQRRQHRLRIGSVQGGQTVQSAALIGDGQQGSPLRSPSAGASELDPAVARAVVEERVINGEPGARAGVVGDVRVGSLRGLGHHPVLIRWLSLVGARTAAAAAPAGLTKIGVAAAEVQRGPPHREHVRRGGGPGNRGPAIARGRHEGHARVAEIAVVRRFARELTAAPAQRDHAGMAGRVTHGRQKIGITGRGRLHQQNLRPRRDGVRPLDIEGLLQLPPARRVGRRQAGAAILVDAGDGRRGQTELGAEGVQVRLDVRVVIGIHDRNRLARAVPSDGAEADLVEPVGLLNLRRRVRAGGRGTVGDQRAHVEHRAGNEGGRGGGAENFSDFETVDHESDTSVPRRDAEAREAAHQGCSLLEERGIRVMSAVRCATELQDRKGGDSERKTRRRECSGERGRGAGTLGNPSETSTTSWLIPAHHRTKTRLWDSYVCDSLRVTIKFCSHAIFQP